MNGREPVTEPAAGAVAPHAPATGLAAGAVAIHASATDPAAGVVASHEPATEPATGAMAPHAPRTPRATGPARGVAGRVAGWMARQARAMLRPTPLNPLIELELRSRMRRGRTVLLLLSFTGALGLLLVIAYILTGGIGGGIYGPSPFELSYSLFQAAMVAELILVGAVAAATAAGGISGERERQTWEVLLTTRLPAWRIVTGKLVTAVLLVFWLVVASLPVFLPLFRFGAVSPGTLARILGLFLASGLAWAAIGLFFSALFRRTIVAVIASYATAAAWVILTALARPLRDALLGPPQFTGPFPSPLRPVGPFLVELMNPVLVLLRTLASPVVGFVDWMFGGVAIPGARLALGARVARALGEHGYYWVYMLSALGLTLVLAALTTRLVARRRV